ncbi:MAG: zinc-ribbon domain-containing protein [Pseudomonadota bacterium]
MRLICPNCAAHYEVPEEVIPEDGRDVQCSACGDTWFQLHPSHPDYNQPYDLDAPEEEPDTDFEDEIDVDAALEKAGAAYTDAEDDPPDEDDEDKPHTQPTPRELPEDVANVLREEAARETQAREAERGGLETQPDLGLSEGDDAEHRSRQAQERMARLRGFDSSVEEPVSDLVQSPDPDTPAEAPDIDLGTRANLLPDVEDVDQKIEAQSDGAAEAAAARDGSRVATQKEPRSGFARGMRLSILLFVLAAALYIFAPQLSAAVPALQEPLVGYTGLIDQGRTALQGVIGQVLK